MHTKSQNSLDCLSTSICSPEVNYYSVGSLLKVPLLVKENKLG